MEVDSDFLIEQKSINVDLCFNTKKSRVLFRLVNWVKNRLLFSTRKKVVFYFDLLIGEKSSETRHLFLTSCLVRTRTVDYVLSHGENHISCEQEKLTTVCLKSRLMFVGQTKCTTNIFFFNYWEFSKSKNRLMIWAWENKCMDLYSFCTRKVECIDLYFLKSIVHFEHIFILTYVFALVIKIFISTY